MSGARLRVEQGDHVGGRNSEAPPQKKPRGVIAERNTVKLLTKMIENLKKKPSDFDPSSVVWWDVGESVPFLFLCLAFELIEKNTKIVLKDYIVCNLLGTIVKTSPDDLVAVLYLTRNQVGPVHEGLELQPILKATIIDALAEAYVETEAHIRHQYKMKGDLALVANECQNRVCKPAPAALTVAKVFETLRNLAKGPQQETEYTEKELIAALLVAATDCEPQYLIRLLQCKLTNHIPEHTLLAALGQAVMYHDNHSQPPPPNISSPLEEAAKLVKEVYSVFPVYEKIIPALLRNGLWNLSNTCGLTLGIPVRPMLVKPTNGVSKIIEKFQDMEYTCEYKYDGERAQIHFMEDGSLVIYSCNGKSITGKYPDVSAAVLRSKKQFVTSFVLDCVTVAYDRARKINMPSQILSTRACNYGVCIYAFDILFHNGQSLIKEQLQVRRQCLYESFEKEPGYFQFATTITSYNPEEIQRFHEAAVDHGCQGIIIKPLVCEAAYEPSKRTNAWLELRKNYMDRVGVRLNLVPIGAFYGRGIRAGVYGSFLLACYNPAKDEFQSICKIGSGLSQVELEERYAVMRSTVMPNSKSNYRCGESINPDVWFDTTEVWEVTAAALFISAAYRAAVGIIDSVKGISLSFPRVSRILEDKNPRESTSSSEVAEMYNARIQNRDYE